MEDDLEMVADNRQRLETASFANFGHDFSPTLDTAEKEGFVPKIMTDIDCPTCGAKLQKIWFKSKYFYGCSRYPECTYSAPVEEISFNKEDYAADFDWDQKCPKCEIGYESAPWPIWSLPGMHELSRMQRHRQYPQKRRSWSYPRKTCPLAQPSTAQDIWSHGNLALAKPFTPAPLSPNAMSSSTISISWAKNIRIIPAPLM